MAQHNHSMATSGEHTLSNTYSKNDSSAYHGAGNNVGHLGGNGQAWSWTRDTNSAGAHTHDINSIGNNVAHNNLQPYEVVYRWKRAA